MNSDDINRKPTEKQKFCFWCSHYWQYTHICLQSDSVDLEQFTTHYDCFKKVSVQFLPTDTNWKGGTLDKSLFILVLGKITVQFHPPTTELRAISCFIFGHRHIVFMESLLFKQLLNLNRMALKNFNLVFVSWHKSKTSSDIW